MTKGQYAQWLAATGLFGTWVALVCLKVQGADDLILFIKGGLAAFGAYCWNDLATKRGIALAGGAASGPGAATPFSQQQQ